MRPSIALAVAILAETTATLALRASIDAPAFLALVALGYTAAFALLGIALRGGMPLGVAYGIWVPAASR